jgi:hypothetical protein
MRLRTHPPAHAADGPAAAAAAAAAERWAGAHQRGARRLLALARRNRGVYIKLGQARPRTSPSAPAGPRPGRALKSYTMHDRGKGLRAVVSPAPAGARVAACGRAAEREAER